MAETKTTGLPGIEKELTSAVRDAVRESLDEALASAMERAVEQGREAFRAELAEAMDRHFSASCRCPVPDSRKPAINRILDVMEDAGNGDILRGISEVRNNAEWTSGVRRQSRENKKLIIGGIVSVIVTAVSALALSVWGRVP